MTFSNSFYFIVNIPLDWTLSLSFSFFLLYPSSSSNISRHFLLPLFLMRHSSHCRSLFQLIDPGLRLVRCYPNVCTELKDENNKSTLRQRSGSMSEFHCPKYENSIERFLVQPRFLLCAASTIVIFYLYLRTGEIPQELIFLVHGVGKRVNNRYLNRV